MKENPRGTKAENDEDSCVEQELADSSESPDTSSFSRIESIAENGVNYTSNQCYKIFKRCRRFAREARIYEKIEQFMKYLLANPALLVGFTIVTAILIVPVLLFTIFAILNVAIAFTGFMIIEVVLLIIGLTVLCCILFFMVSSIVVTGVTFIVSVYVTYFSYSLVKKKIQST